MDKKRFNSSDPVAYARRYAKGRGFTFDEDWIIVIKKYNRTTGRYKRIGVLTGMDGWVFHKREKGVY